VVACPHYKDVGPLLVVLQACKFRHFTEGLIDKSAHGLTACRFLQSLTRYRGACLEGAVLLVSDKSTDLRGHADPVKIFHPDLPQNRTKPVQ
jgi:hypothetical protein